ncbi:L-asparaginase [Heyndrickxia sporothermodurans]|nr:L-asparaginase [Heyndrickxia sporothermodurans]
MKKDILVIHTGGTISMFEDKTGAVKPGNENPLSSHTMGLSNLANIIIKEPFNLPSPHITMTEMLQIKKLILDEINQKDIDGIVITHGTDTLEETAYFLDLTLGLNIPIVVTGAMRSSNEVGSDGLYNLITSIRVAACDDAREKGVLVVLNDEIHTAKNVTKTHTSNVSTFQSPQYGPIGIVTKQGIFFHNQPTLKENYKIDQITKQVALLKAHAGMDSLLFYAIKELNFDGLVVEALGQGNLPPATVEGIKALIDVNIPVIIVSRCFNGIAQDVYGYDGGGKYLREMGAIFSNGLNGQKARIKLLIGLSHTNNMKFIEDMFH